MKIDKVSVIVPVYNEEEAIAHDLEVIIETMDASRWDYELIVVDDASKDNTAKIVAGFENVQLLQHRENRGGGFARNTGIKAASGDIVVVTDGDGTYPNQDIPLLLNKMEEENLDMVVGARTKEAGTMRFLRMRAKWFIRKLAESLSGFTIPDLNSGLRAMRRDVFFQFMELLPWGHSWVSTITLAMLSSGYSVGFLEIDYYPRKGTSTFHPLKDTYSYITLVIRTVTWFNPLKVFFPLALVIIAAGLVKIVVDSIIYSYFRITGTTVIVLLVGIQLVAIGLLADLIVQRGK